MPNLELIKPLPTDYFSINTFNENSTRIENLANSTAPNWVATSVTVVEPDGAYVLTIDNFVFTEGCNVSFKAPAAPVGASQYVQISGDSAQYALRTMAGVAVPESVWVENSWVTLALSSQKMDLEPSKDGTAFLQGGGAGGGTLSSKVTITVIGSLPVGVGDTRVVVRNERLGLYMSLPLDANDQAIFDVLSGLRYHIYLINYPDGYYGGEATISPNAGEDVEETIDMLTTPDIVGVYVNQTAKTLTYTDGNIGFAPAKMDLDGWTWGDWLNHWLVTECRPCLLKNGVVQYYLDPDDYTKKLDGSPADITTGMDGDVMVEFPLCYIKITTDTTGYFLRFSRTKIDETWTANAFLNRDGVPMPTMYMAAYDGAEVDGKLRSLSGLAPTVNKTIAQFRVLANANGLGYEQQEWLKRSYVQMLFLLLTRATDSQGVVGKGNVTSSAAIPAGTMNKKGLCWGDQTAANGAKFLGIENFWGNTYKFCDGLIRDGGTVKVKLYAPYNDTAIGYTSDGTIPTSSSVSYIDKIAPTPARGMVPSSTITDEPTSFYRDQISGAGSGVFLSFTGGDWAYGVHAGLFYIHVNSTATRSNANLSASLSFTPQ